MKRKPDFIVGRFIFLSSLILFATRAWAAPKPIDGNEWPAFRGPENTGVSRATNLVDSFTNENENVLWKVPIGGRSNPIIMDHRAYVIHETGQQPAWQEEVVCLNADTGDILWKYKFDIFHTDIPLDRVGWTSLAGDPETGNVYAHGVQGLFLCLNKDGNLVWSKSVGEEFGRISGYGGRTHSPIIDQDLVIISFLNSSLGDHGKGMHRYLAMDKKTGDIRWWSAPGKDPYDTNYSFPTIAVIDQQRLLIGGNGDGGIHAMKVNTGEKVWSFDLSSGGINPAIIAAGDRIYANHGDDNIDKNNIGRVVCIDGKGTGDITKTNELWRFDGFQANYSSSVLHDDRLYVVDNGSNMVALDTKTGAQVWKLKLGRVAKASPAWGDGKLYYGDVNGNFYIVQDTGTEGKILSKIQFPKGPEGPSNIEGGPAIAYGRVYVINRNNLYCLAKKDAGEPKPITIEALPDTGPASQQATTLLVSPAEVHIGPDAKVNFRARQYDAKGRFISEVAAKWKTAMKGAVSERGEFVPDAKAGGQFGMVEANVGELKATARVRVIPALPIVQDFEKIPEGAAPRYWVGASKVKFQTIVQDGNHVLKKDADNPRFRRANVFIGFPSESNYTITSDVRVDEKEMRGPPTGGGDTEGTRSKDEGKAAPTPAAPSNAPVSKWLPDAGLINSGYIFDIRGNENQLRIVGWIPMPRIVKTVEFKPEPGAWYTMKCRVDYEGKKGWVRGKIWKRGEAEPKEWTIELEDPSPYRRGSPGLACFSLAEVYYDNVKIEKNQ